MTQQADRIAAQELQEILRLRQDGYSFAAIGRKLGRSRDGIRKAWKRHVNADGKPPPETTQTPSPPPHEPGKLVDSMDLDGSVSIYEHDRLYSPAELKELAGLGEEWLAANHTANRWQVAMKLGAKGEERVEKVDLWQSKTKFRRIIGEELRDAILDWAASNVQPMRVPLRLYPAKGEQVDTRPPYAVSWGLWDAHVGLYAFGKEVGEDYDVDMAFNRCVNSVDDMVEELRLYNIQKLWMPVGNDFLHFDNVHRRTTSGNHDLDTDTRFARAYRAAIKILCYMVQRATEICPDVDVFWVPGNHDTLTSYTLVAMLRERFRNDPRVTVDVNENPQKIRRHGGTVVMYEHGQGVRPAQWPLIFHEHVLNHARTNGLDTRITYKEVQVGHTHQKRVRNFESEIPTNGIKIVTNPALCNTDFWHHSQGLVGEPMKSVEAYRYDTVGYRGSHAVWARDDEREI